MSASERFEKEFPRYLSIGMTKEEYWDQDCLLVKPFREAQRLRDEREDAMAWLQGRYIYDALRQVSPLFHDFTKGRPKENPYYEKPLMELARERKEQENCEALKQKGINFMLQWAQRVNKTMKSRKAGGEKA